MDFPTGRLRVAGHWPSLLRPALRCTRPDVVSTLKDTAGNVLGGSGQVRLRKVLVVAQVSLSLLLLVGAGLFLRSLRNLGSLGTGFPTENLIGFEVNPALNGYTPERCKLFYQQLTTNLHSVPGVQSPALASVRILENDEWDSTVTVEGYEAKPGEDMNPFFNSVSPGYFLTMGIPLLAGRDFTVQDTGTIAHGEGPDNQVPGVVIVNQKLARHYFGDKNPLGRHIGFGGDPGTKADVEIIGVVKDAKYTNLRDEIPQQVFVPYLAGRRVGGMTGYVRTTLDPDLVFAAARAEVKKLDTNMPVYAMRTVETQIDRSLLNERLVASLSAAFGFLATLLSMIGLYGVMAYVVAFRTREIGIRMALGARSSAVIKLVVGQGLKLVVIGIAIGLASAFALGRLLTSFLFGITHTDPGTLMMVLLILAGVALLACYIPARKATKVDPMVALRYE